MSWLQPRQHGRQRVSDGAAYRGARGTARLARAAIVWLACLWASAAPAGGDPMRTPECMRARAELDAALAAADAPHGARLRHARAAALHACLGAQAGTPARSGAPDPPRAVPPTLVAPAVIPLPAPVVVPPAPSPPARAATITTCDPAGCWDSEGHRLNQIGPFLVGPHGACTAVAGVLTCP